MNPIDREWFYLDGRTYRQQYRKCKGSNGTTTDGKVKHCRVCEEGPGHGPYWYADSQYIGKVLPPHILKILEMLETRKADLKTIRNEAEVRSREAYNNYCRAEEDKRAIDHLATGQAADPRVLKRLGLEDFIVRRD